jgi:Holliday junction resolvase RusA-like endonuclease
MNLRFTVLGTPVTQGSKKMIPHKASGRMIMLEDNRRLKPWRQAISDTVGTLPDRPSEPSTLPIGIVLDFYFEPPKTVKRPYPTVKLDVEKLARSVFDALSKVVYVDDGQVVDARLRKHYGSPARVEVFVGELC